MFWFWFLGIVAVLIAVYVIVARRRGGPGYGAMTPSERMDNLMRDGSDATKQEARRALDRSRMQGPPPGGGFPF